MDEDVTVNDYIYQTRLQKWKKPIQKYECFFQIDK